MNMEDQEEDTGNRNVTPYVKPKIVYSLHEKMMIVRKVESGEIKQVPCLICDVHHSRC